MVIHRQIHVIAEILVYSINLTVVRETCDKYKPTVEHDSHEHNIIITYT